MPRASSGERYLASSVGGDRVSPASARIVVGDGTERFCCITSGPSFDIVTGNRAWAAPQAAAPDTWTADDERAELAAHEYIHVWQYDVGGSACMVGGPRWLSEGMAESLAYRSLVAGGRIVVGEPRRVHEAPTAERALRHAALVSNAVAADANPFALGYLAVDRLLAVPAPTRSGATARASAEESRGGRRSQRLSRHERRNVLLALEAFRLEYTVPRSRCSRRSTWIVKSAASAAIAPIAAHTAARDADEPERERHCR